MVSLWPDLVENDVSQVVSAQAGVSVDSEGVLKKVAAIVERQLGKSLQPESQLMEAGLDSLGAVELRSALGVAFDLELPATLAFDYPTTAALADFIVAQLAVSSYSPPTTGLLHLLLHENLTCLTTGVLADINVSAELLCLTTKTSFPYD